MMVSSCTFRHPMYSLIVVMRAWHTSLILWILYGMHRILKRPQGELKVRSLEFSSSTLIYQKAFEASSLVKYCVPAISWNMSVSADRWWCSLLLPLFRFWGSKQTRRLPLCFSTPTREETHSVSSLVAERISHFCLTRDLIRPLGSTHNFTQSGWLILFSRTIFPGSTNWGNLPNTAHFSELLRSVQTSHCLLFNSSRIMPPWEKQSNSWTPYVYFS